MPEPSPFDKRQPIADSLRQEIARQLATIPAGKRATLLVIVDEHGPRAHLAARLNGEWKVAFEAGAAWTGVMVEGAW